WGAAVAGGRSRMARIGGRARQPRLAGDAAPAVVANLVRAAARAGRHRDVLVHAHRRARAAAHAALMAGVARRRAGRPGRTGDASAAAAHLVDAAASPVGEGAARIDADFAAAGAAGLAGVAGEPAWRAGFARCA